MSEKDADYYVNLDWTLVEGTDLDFNGEPYFYLEIKEFPNFVYCAKTKEKAYEGYKHQLKLTIMIMLEDGDRIPNPGEEPEEVY